MDLSLVVLIVLVGLVNALLVLAGVALGGALVYRTKREPHETLFARPQKPSSAVAPDDSGGEATQTSEWDVPDEESEMGLGADVMQHNQRFLQQQDEHPTFFQAPQGEDQG